jgi:PBP4 family serine-type D-alanyl-D-alanine carboxypeptidase
VLLPILLATAMSLPPTLAAGLPHAPVRSGFAAETLKTTTARHKKPVATTRTRNVRLIAAAAIHAATPNGLAELADDLASMLSRTKIGKWGVLVVSLSSGDTLFGYNPDDQLLPASTMKLFTSAVALDRFGANGRFETTVLRTAELEANGVLHGDLVLRGAGDPTLAGKIAEDGSDPPMEALARQIVAAGVKHVTGGIVGDGSAFLDARVPDGWRTRYLHASYAARVSALSFNENRITVVVRPAGTHADLSFRPAASGLAISNGVKVTPGSRSARIGIRQDSTGRLIVSGWIGDQCAQRDYSVMVEGPELFAAGALRAALIAQGVTVDGPVRIGTAPDGAVSLAAFQSPTLDRIITQMNGESNNHFANSCFACGAGVGARVRPRTRTSCCAVPVRKASSADRRLCRRRRWPVDARPREPRDGVVPRLRAASAVGIGPRGVRAGGRGDRNAEAPHAFHGSDGQPAREDGDDERRCVARRLRHRQGWRAARVLVHLQRQEWLAREGSDGRHGSDARELHPLDRLRLDPSVRQVSGATPDARGSSRRPRRTPAACFR